MQLNDFKAGVSLSGGKRCSCFLCFCAENANGKRRSICLNSIQGGKMFCLSAILGLMKRLIRHEDLIAFANVPQPGLKSASYENLIREKIT